MPRTCKICRKKFEPKYNSVQMVCSVACSYEYSKKEKSKSWKQKKKVLKDDLKTRTDHLKELQAIFNKWIRETKEPTCISCGTDLRGRKYDAGHYRSVGSCPELRFEPFNVYPQCVHCNQYLSGNLIEYRKRLVKKIGLDKVEWLESDHQPKKYTVDQIKDLKKYYKDLLKNK